MQFGLKSDEDTELILSPIGNLAEGGCRTLELSDGVIEKIQVSFSQKDNSINAIYYWKGGRSISYGTLDESAMFEWDFSEEL